jgi:hypothetical protein
LVGKEGDRAFTPLIEAVERMKARAFGGSDSGKNGVADSRPAALSMAILRQEEESRGTNPAI